MINETNETTQAPVSAPLDAPLSACTPPAVPADAIAGAVAAGAAVADASGRSRGVYFHSGRGVWVAALWGNSRPLHLGEFGTQEGATGAVKAALSLARRGLLAATIGTRIDPVLRARRELELGKVPTGATFHRPSGLWQAKIGWKRQKISLGYYGTQEEASAAYWRARARVEKGKGPKP